MPTWYDDACFILHYEHQFYRGEYPPPLSGVDPAQVRRLLERIRPDAVQYYAKGSAGLVPFTTRYGNEHPSVMEQPEADVLRVFRDVTRELDIRFVIAYSGLVDFQAADWRSEWQRIGSNYSPYPNRALCPNHGYVDELMLPQLEEILSLYEPDGVWIDGENWTVSPCWCSVCTNEYQMLHGRSAPYDRSDSLWKEWIDFHRDSFQRYVGRVARYLHDRSGDLLYATNAGYATHQPEEVAGLGTLGGGPERLSWDLSPAYSLRQAGLEARFFDSRGLPFDLLTWNQSSARPWAQGRLPALPTYPKTFDHLAQEGSVILANGGRWSVWVTAYSDDSLPEKQHEVVAQTAEFARERAPWCIGTQSDAYVAVLHSSATHRAAGNGLYDPGPSLDRIRGAHQALLELHHPHDVVNEEGLRRNLARYWVIVLPEQIALPPDLDEELTEWVRDGGRLIATGRVSPRILEDIPTFALEDVLGVQWTGRQEPSAHFLYNELPLRIAAPVYHVTLNGAEMVIPLCGTGNEFRPNEWSIPAVTRNTLGEGRGYYLAADFFAYYHRSQYPGLRDFFGAILGDAMPQPPLLTTAPPSVELVLRRKGNATILHWVNHSPGKSLAQNNPFIERVPPSEPFSVTIAVGEEPLEVRLQPEGIEPEWSFSEGALTAFVPPVHLHTALVVTGPERPEAPPGAETEAEAEAEPEAASPVAPAAAPEEPDYPPD